MENIEIAGSKGVYFVPTVNFNKTTGKLKIEGESYLEDTRAFYLPLIKWVENYTKESKNPLTLDIDLSYYNTSSSKHILEILYILKDFQTNGGQVSVNWYYAEDDEDAEEEIEDFQIESGIEINLIAKEK